MKKALLSIILASAAFAQKSPFLGRWDLTITPQSGNPYPGWMEVTEKEGKLEGRQQPRGGAWRPIAALKVDNGHLIATIQGAGRGPEVTWDFTASGDKITGSEKRGEAAGPSMVGVRAPELKKPMPKSWSEPVSLFNGKDLTGWEPIGNVQNNKWVARDGELVNDNAPPADGEHRGPGAANIKTTGNYQDFKLHIEVNCPEHGNSGIYLRGRYEIQVGTEGGTQPTHEMGAVYSHYAPMGNIGNKLGEWTAFDITFVGRYLTVYRDGVKIHDNVEIPGPTGGALDSNEAEPGPFFLQGDHIGVIRYRNIRIQAAQ
jgi:Domain of Unknown Function (DUF1080)